MTAMLALDIAAYFAGLLLGLAANVALDVQLRRPDIRQAAGLLIFGVLVWGALIVTGTPFTAILLPLIWAGTGLLTGLGSRGLHAPS